MKFSDLITVKHQIPDLPTPDHLSLGPAKFRNFEEIAGNLMVKLRGCRN